MRKRLSDLKTDPVRLGASDRIAVVKTTRPWGGIPPHEVSDTKKESPRGRESGAGMERMDISVVAQSPSGVACAAYENVHHARAGSRSRALPPAVAAGGAAGRVRHEAARARRAPGLQFVPDRGPVPGGRVDPRRWGRGAGAGSCAERLATRCAPDAGRVQRQPGRAGCVDRREVCASRVDGRSDEERGLTFALRAR